jgi:alkanesulfonate monooxygenase SsuD/methylene tetrahydromethanopterin reductase-like flavin-dependent oxidoreductase (luciferase family)
MTTTARASITDRQPGGNGMKFGLFGGGKVGGANPLGDSYGYRDFISYICDAEELGFESAFLVEHHFTGVGQLSASLNLLSYIAAKTSRIRLGTAVVVLPWHNPVLLAEQIATLDVLCEGRFDMGVGRGYRKEEFQAFCIPMSEAQERYNECFELLLKSLSSRERFSHHGKYWNFDNIVVEPAPTQQPHPPVWMAAGRPEGIAFVAGQGYNVLLDQIGSVDDTIERVQVFLKAQAAAGIVPDAMRCGVTRALHIVNSEAERQQAYARRIDDIAEELREGHKRLRRFEQEVGPQTAETFGKVETYRKEVKILLPLNAGAGASADTVNLKVVSQGCWDGGICYPPLHQEALLNLPNVAAAAEPSATEKTPDVPQISASPPGGT